MYEAKKHPLSANGKYYIDLDMCIIFCTCEDIAPNNFKYDENLGTTYVFKQPETIEEQKLCKEAKYCCPVEAIYDDGEFQS